jgi:hypothetical protein
MGTEVRLQLSEDGAEAPRLAELTDYLRQDLLLLDVENVVGLRTGTPPPGSRAFDVAAVGGLLVSLGSAADGLRAVVAAVRHWLARGDGVRRTVRLEIGGDTLELSEASLTDQDRLIDLFVGRHAARSTEL